LAGESPEAKSRQKISAGVTRRQQTSADVTRHHSDKPITKTNTVLDHTLFAQRYSHLSPGYLRQASLTLDKTFANLGATVPLLPQLPLGAATVAIPETLVSTKAALV
jgi:hypothetical protein